MVLALLLVVVAAPARPARAAERKPNIIIILADDLGYADVSFDGRREWTTPNLHRLSQDGKVTAHPFDVEALTKRVAALA